MKKIIFLFLMAFLLSGCTTEVEINITKDKIDETIKIHDLKSNVLNGDSVNEIVESNLYFFEHDFSFYGKKDFEKDNIIGRIYSYSTEIDFWKDSSRIRYCYEAVSVDKTNDYLVINTSNEYRCGYIFDAKNVTLTIVSDLKVNTHNADKVEGNKYIWYINEENYQYKPISLSFDLKSESNQEETLDEFEKEEKNNSKIMIIILGVLAGIVVVASVIIFIKVKNSNN